MKKYFILFATALLMLSACNSPKDKISIAGTWLVSLDSLQTFQSITLPGTTDDAGLGVPNTLEPALTRPQVSRLTRKNSFLGEAFYKKEIHIPESMAGRPLEIKLERVLWESSVWIDGEKLDGDEESLTTAHIYRMEQGLDAGRHEIMIRVDNRKKYDLSWRDLAHAYTNDTQIIWNGVLGEMSIRALAPVEIARVDVYPYSDTKQVEIVTVLTRHESDILSTGIAFQIDKGKTIVEEAAITGTYTIYRSIYQMPEDAELWDEFNPAMHKLTVQVYNDKREVNFGIRDFYADGNKIYVNGRRVFLRGTLNCCIYPLTGTPPLTPEGWEKEMKVCKEWGLNHIRFHSWCPPEAAFEVADKMGIYLQVELPDWARTIGNEDVDTFLANEYDRIIMNYGNHPSFCMLTCGNELDRGYDWLNGMLRYMKSSDYRHLYSNSTYSMGAGHKGYPEPEDQFMVASRTYLGQIRGQDYLGTESPDFTHDFSGTTADFDLPLISHEVGQYAVYPRVSEISKYTGVLDPLNLKGVRNALEEKGRLDKAEDYTMASGRLGAILYKEEVERALKTPRLSGFQLLGLQDFSGQETALVGLVDAFWDNKGLVSEEWFRQACSPVTPLARYKKPCWTSDEKFNATLEVANYWKEDIKGAKVTWKIEADGKVLAKGSQKADLPTGTNTALKEAVSVDLSKIKKATQLKFSVALKGTEWKNSWNVWVYPAEQPEFDNMVTSDVVLALAALEEGKNVLLSPKPQYVKGMPGQFMPVFWSPVFFAHNAGTMGVYCNPQHPGLADFPTEMHSDWQWWNLTKNSKAVDVDAYPALGTIVEAVDNFVGNRRLSYIFEAKVGKGKLIFSTMDLLSDKVAGMPDVAQMLTSLREYMNSSKFNPELTLTNEQILDYISNDEIKAAAKMVSE